MANNHLYENPDEVGTAGKQFGALIASRYLGNNSVLLRLQNAKEYLERRRVRKVQAQNLEKAIALEAKGKVEDAEKMLNKEVRPEKLNLGELRMLEKDAWYLFLNGKKFFRIPEPEEGIEAVFECEFKRVEVAG